MTVLCISIRPSTIDELYVQHTNAQVQHPDLIEIRLDAFDTIPFAHLRRCVDATTIVSIGHRAPDEVYIQLAALHPGWLDIDSNVNRSVFETLYGKVQVIASHHDFEKTPSDLQVLFETLQTLPCVHVKLVTMAHTSLDALRMLECVQKNSCIGFCMGQHGRFSRVLAPIFGSSIIYASLEGLPTAPGQLSYKELCDVYHVKAISRNTTPFALVGGPFIEQSKGHILHNQLFRLRNRDAVYVKIFLEKEEFWEAFAFFQKLDFGGLSVTTPLKSMFSENAPYNTVSFHGSSYTIHNTDGIGMLDAIEKHCTVTEKHVVVIGAGSTGRAIAREAAVRGAQVTIVNRTVEKALAVAEDVGAVAVSLDEIEDVLCSGYDVLVQATTSGKVAPFLPFKEKWFIQGAIVADVVCADTETLWIAMARRKGAIVVTGDDMWHQQAKYQQVLWK